MAYVPGSGTLLWCTRPRQDTVSSSYLLALLQGTYEVPHWQTPACYQALLEGKPVLRRNRCTRQSLAINNVNEDDWHVPVLEQSTMISF